MLNVSRVPYSFRDEKSPCVTSLACRRSSLREACLRILERHYWELRTSDLFGLQSPISMGFPECRSGPTGLPANSRRIVRSGTHSASGATPLLSKEQKKSSSTGSV